MDKCAKTIAIVINTSWNVYNFRLNLLKALQSQGHKIVVIAPRDAYTEKLIEEGFDFQDLSLDNDSTNTIRELGLFYNLLRIFYKVKPDVILQYTIKPNIYGTLAASFLQIPTINNISGLGTVFLSNNLSSLVARGLYWLTQRLAYRVFFQNYDDMEIFVKYFFIRRSKAMRIPGSGIDTKKFKPMPSESTDLTFLFIGRLLKDKGIEEYIEAIQIVKKRYPDVKFQIVGSLYKKNPTATKSSELEKWVNDKLVEYLGHTDDIKIPISKSSCIVLPSYREGLSRALLEAASMAKPIITTNVPGCKDVVEDGVNGYLCEVKNAIDLADKMIRMIELDAPEREKMGIKGRQKTISEFSEEIIINKYANIIDNIRPKRFFIF